MQQAKSDPDFAPRLGRALVRAGLGLSGIGSLRRLSAGASQETWAFEAYGAEGTKRLILRRAPGGTHQHETAIGLEKEAALIRAAVASGVPAPEVHYVLDPADGVGRGFVAEFIDGETLGGKIARDPGYAGAREGLAAACGRAMAHIHAVPRAKLPELEILGAKLRVDRLFERYKRSSAPRPVLSLAFEWLRDNLPPDVAIPCLVHGDFRNGNMIVGTDGLRAVLDWEVAHLGDPAEDLGWIAVGAWTYGVLEKPVGGFGSREELAAGYRAAGGADIPHERIHWWEVLGTVRWATSCAAMTQSFREGVDRTTDRAMIARRASESELDVMHLLFGAP